MVHYLRLCICTFVLFCFGVHFVYRNYEVAAGSSEKIGVAPRTNLHDQSPLNNSGVIEKGCYKQHSGNDYDYSIELKAVQWMKILLSLVHEKYHRSL